MSSNPAPRNPSLALPSTAPGLMNSHPSARQGQPGTRVVATAFLPRVSEVICKPFCAWIYLVSRSLFTWPAQPTSGLTASRCSLPAVWTQAGFCLT